MVRHTAHGRATLLRPHSDEINLDRDWPGPSSWYLVAQL